MKTQKVYLLITYLMHFLTRF